MSGSTGNQYDKEYEAFQLFEQIQDEKKEVLLSAEYAAAPEKAILSEDIYCEIEYDFTSVRGENAGMQPQVSYPIPGPERMEERPKDEIRELFNRMRPIARENLSLKFGRSRFF